jgi:ribosomal protein L28
MARVCHNQGPMGAKQLSYATNRRGGSCRICSAVASGRDQNRWVNLRLTNAALRTIDKGHRCRSGRAVRRAASTSKRSRRKRNRDA